MVRYIIVNERVPKGTPRHCAMCAAHLEHGYLREISTRILYCTEWCYDEHCAEAIEAMARRVS